MRRCYRAQLAPSPSGVRGGMRSSDQVAQQRRKLLGHARELARSGRHADHRSIVAEIEQMEGFALAQARFQEYAFLAQLDRMCRMARDSRTNSPEADGFSSE